MINDERHSLESIDKRIQSMRKIYEDDSGFTHMVFGERKVSWKQLLEWMHQYPKYLMKSRSLHHIGAGKPRPRVVIKSHGYGHHRH